jgi:D-alanine-D-alanine ligase
MRIGIAYDLKKDFAACGGAPDDLFEEYDSEETVDAIAAALRAAGHEPVKLGGGRRFIERTMKTDVDLVFNIAEGRGSRSREAHVPAACEMLGIPYTHSDPLTLAVSLDKEIAKRLVASHGVATAPFCLLERPEDLAHARLPSFPVIAKLDCEGSSMGIRRHSRCDTREELEAQLGALFAGYRGPVLVESFLTGLEATVGILGTGASARVIAAMEVAPKKASPEGFIYSLEVKRNYLEEVDYHVPPRLPAPALAAIERTALAAYRALGCQDVGRVDVRLDGAGTPCFIEVNPLPGLNPVTGDLPILSGRAGMGYERLIAEIVENARARLALAGAETPARAL